MKKPRVEELTLRERIGQTAAVRNSLIANNQDNLGEFFEKEPYGNIWTSGKINLKMINVADELDGDKDFSNDIKNRLLNERISDMIKVPILGAMDAERGCGGAFSFFTQTTSNTGISAIGDTKAAYDIAKYIAREMLLCGVRWNWGPVGDNASPFCAVSLTRCFSADPKIISDMTVEYIKGVQSEGVAATVKHFPGADRDEYRDSHFSDQFIRQNLDDWYERQGCVFQAAIDAGVYSVMVGHTAFPAADDTMIKGRYIPATFSRKIVTELLKEKMGFKGVVVTDGVGMKAIITMFPDPEEFYAAFYNAGCDVILGPVHDDFIDIVERAVKNGKIPEERINDACSRVLDMKEKVGLFDTPKLNVTEEDRMAARDLCRKTSLDYAPKSISWMSRKNNLVPVKKENIKKVQIVYIGYAKGVLDSINEYVVPEFEKRGATVSVCEQVLNEAHIRQIADENDLILYFAHIAPHSPYGMGGFVMEKAAQFVHVLAEGAEKSICVSTSSQYLYFDWFPAAENFINLYCASADYLQTLVAGIYGECEFTGKCPYDADPLAPRL